MPITAMPRALASAAVITSYSIHYTKLYEPFLRGRAWEAALALTLMIHFLPLAWARAAVIGQVLSLRFPGCPVITSYSIHYTKLYDSGGDHITIANRADLFYTILIQQ